jgi:hypothetical protein
MQIINRIYLNRTHPEPPNVLPPIMRHKFRGIR